VKREERREKREERGLIARLIEVDTYSSGCTRYSLSLIDKAAVEGLMNKAKMTPEVPQRNLERKWSSV
jgi:hypothetical protein